MKWDNLSSLVFNLWSSFRGRSNNLLWYILTRYFYCVFLKLFTLSETRRILYSRNLNKTPLDWFAWTFFLPLLWDELIYMTLHHALFICSSKYYNIVQSAIEYHVIAKDCLCWSGVYGINSPEGFYNTLSRFKKNVLKNFLNICDPTLLLCNNHPVDFGRTMKATKWWNVRVDDWKVRRLK